MFNRAKFFSVLRSDGLIGSKFTSAQVETLDSILNEIEARKLPINHAAYVLATPVWEVGADLVPVSENLNYSSAARIAKVWPKRFNVASAAPYVHNPEGLANKVYGGRMGNDQPGDGWKYRGRGDCQITGKGMYAKLAALIAVDLVGHPDLALVPSIAARIMVAGMVGGLFTTKRLGQFNDYTAMRAIINPDKNGAAVARIAKRFENVLAVSGY